MLIDYKQQIEHLKEIRKGSIKEGAGYGLPEIDEYIRFKPYTLCLYRLKRMILNG